MHYEKAVKQKSLIILTGNTNDSSAVEHSVLPDGALMILAFKSLVLLQYDLWPPVAALQPPDKDFCHLIRGSISIQMYQKFEQNSK